MAIPKFRNVLHAFSLRKHLVVSPLFDDIPISNLV
jgi:hypothetical protein